MGKKTNSPKVPKAKKGYLSKKENKDEVTRIIYLLEAILSSFGITTKVVEVHIEEEYILFGLEITMGTKIDDLINLEKDIAFGISSPTGKVEVYPIVGRSLVGIKVPLGKIKLNKEKYKIITRVERVNEIDLIRYIRLLLVNIFSGLARFFFWLISKVSP